MNHDQETVSLKTAIGMWMMDLKGVEEITDINNNICISKHYYNRYVAKARKNINNTFSTIIIDPTNSFDKLDFDVGLHKKSNRWVVNKEKFLKALNEKREIHKTGDIEDYFMNILMTLGIKEKINLNDLDIPN